MDHFHALPVDIQERIHMCIKNDNATKIQAQCRVFLLRKQTNIVGEFYCIFREVYRNYVSVCVFNGMRFYDKVMYVICELLMKDEFHNMETCLSKDIADMEHMKNVPWRSVKNVNQRAFSMREIEDALYYIRLAARSARVLR